MQVCATNRKACIVIRSLSDLAGGDAGGNQVRLWGEGAASSWPFCSSSPLVVPRWPVQVGNFFGLASYHSSIVLAALVAAM